MPRVPTYDNFQTQVSGQPNVQIQAPSGPAPGAIAADQASQFGQSLTRSGDAAGKIALAAADQANQVRVNDAMNQARIAAQDLAYNKDTGYLSLKGNAALTRPDGQSLNQEYGSKLQEQIGALTSSLSNPAQQRAFQMQANDLTTQFRGQVETHMLGEFQTYSNATDDATAKLASDGARLNWNNPDFINGHIDPATGDRVPGAIDQVKAAIMNKMQRTGMTGAVADAALLAGVSHVHEGVVQSALENGDAAYAMSYMEKARAKGELSADDILKLQGHVNQSVWSSLSNTAVQIATAKTMSTLAPNNFDRMTQITLGAESGGKRYGPDGKTLLTSPAGAKGEMQVMDATNVAPGFGVKPAQDNSPDERARVGRDYLQALLQKYGEPAKAWAAYNAGPGALDAALKGAVGDATPDAWLAKLPKETQAYVVNNMKSLNGNSSFAPRTTELDFVNSALAALPANAPPQVVKMAREQAVTQFGVINKSLNEQGDNALAAAQNWITNHKGGTLDQMPPDMLDAVKRYAPGKYDDLDTFSKRVQRGDVVTNNGRYNDIVTNMADYAKMPNASWNLLQNELSSSNFQTLSRQRADFINGGADKSAETLNRAMVNRALDQGLAGLRISTSIAGLKGEAAESVKERIGGIRSYVDTSIFDAQKAVGRKLLPDEIQAHIHNLFATDVTFKNTLWYGGQGADSSQKLMGMQMKDLPDGAATGLTKSLIASGNKSPTSNDILNLYRKLHANK